MKKDISTEILRICNLLLIYSYQLINHLSQLKGLGELEDSIMN